MLRVTLALLVLSVPLAAQSNAPERSVRSGAYTVSQAERGEAMFRSFCASCHAPSFHSGESFQMSWKGRTLYDLFKSLQTTMPEDDPGGLTPQQYAQVIAYMLKLNGYPPGTDSLPTDTLQLRQIRIDGPPPAAGTAPAPASRQRR